VLRYLRSLPDQDNLELWPGAWCLAERPFQATASPEESPPRRSPRVAGFGPTASAAAFKARRDPRYRLSRRAFPEYSATTATYSCLAFSSG